MVLKTKNHRRQAVWMAWGWVWCSPSVFLLKNLTNCGLPNDNWEWQSIGMANNGLSTLPFRNVSPSAPAACGLEMKRQNDVLIYPFSLEPLCVCVHARVWVCVLDCEQKEAEIAYWMMEIIFHCSVEIVCSADLGYVEYPEFPHCCA